MEFADTEFFLCFGEIKSIQFLSSCFFLSVYKQQHKRSELEVLLNSLPASDCCFASNNLYRRNKNVQVFRQGGNKSAIVILLLVL